MADKWEEKSTPGGDTEGTNNENLVESSIPPGQPLAPLNDVQKNWYEVYTKDVLAQIEETTKRRYIDGGSFIFDIPDKIPALWGADKEVLWAKGESLMIAGMSGVGKTTTANQVSKCLLFGGELFGYPIPRIDGRILYLAMDRPDQIARSLARHFTPDQRPYVTKNLFVWKGPPPADFAKYPHLLAQMCEETEAKVVIVDSLKDAAIGLSDDTVGAGYNSARQLVLANGVQVLELHHQVKRGPNGAAPNTLADVYGSAWLTNGAGSVVLLEGKPGDSIVKFRHLKQPAEPVGPFDVLHDHERGVSTVQDNADPLAMARAAGSRGLTVREFAVALIGTTELGRNDIEAARRKLNRLVTQGYLVKGERPEGAGKATAVYLSK